MATQLPYSARMAIAMDSTGVRATGLVGVAASEGSLVEAGEVTGTAGFIHKLLNGAGANAPHIMIRHDGSGCCNAKEADIDLPQSLCNPQLTPYQSSVRKAYNSGNNTTSSIFFR